MVFARESLSFDIDEPEDLRSILRFGEKTHAWGEMQN